MLIEYIHAAMRQAKYKILEDGAFFGEIPGFPGLWASADTLEACRDELQSALEDWIVLGLQMGHDLPSVGNLRLTPEPEMSET